MGLKGAGDDRERLLLGVEAGLRHDPVADQHQRAGNRRIQRQQVSGGDSQGVGGRRRIAPQLVVGVLGRQHVHDQVASQGRDRHLRLAAHVAVHRVAGHREHQDAHVDGEVEGPDDELDRVVQAVPAADVRRARVVVVIPVERDVDHAPRCIQDHEQVRGLGRHHPVALAAGAASRIRHAHVETDPAASVRARRLLGLRGRALAAGHPARSARVGGGSGAVASGSAVSRCARGPARAAARRAMRVAGRAIAAAGRAAAAAAGGPAAIVRRSAASAGIRAGAGAPRRAVARDLFVRAAVHHDGEGCRPEPQDRRAHRRPTVYTPNLRSTWGRCGTL
jgi:hypothetical protein